MSNPDFTGVVTSVSAGYPANLGPSPSVHLFEFRLEMVEPPIPAGEDSVFYVDMNGAAGAAIATIVVRAFGTASLLKVGLVAGSKRSAAWVQCDAQ